MYYQLKEIYDEVIKFYRSKVMLKLYDTPKNYDENEIKWLELIDHVYVIGTEKTTNDCIDNELIAQGINVDITKLIIPDGNFLIEYFKNNSEIEILHKWLNIPTFPHSAYRPYKQINVLGCHISHAIIAEDVIKNGYQKVLVFEDDVSFKIKIDCEFIDYLNDLINKIGDIDYLNLGGYMEIPNLILKEINLKDLKRPQIIKTPSSLTHSYIMNNKVAEKLKNSINTDLPVEKSFDDVFNKEQHYRGGADDFFTGFIENRYAIVPPITYQKFIGNNVERLTDINC